MEQALESAQEARLARRFNRDPALRRQYGCQADDGPQHERWRQAWRAYLDFAKRCSTGTSEEPQRPRARLG